MSTLNYIVDEQLPVNQDFELLKQQGLAYIQEYCGNEWTNLNASDPGITILDELCFALTELGYCNDFPVSDILTNSSGKLTVNNQFYLPQTILTTSPVTINDYIKYIIDGINGIRNVQIDTNSSPDNTIRGYKVYLLFQPSVPPSAYSAICKEALYCLNKQRNIGEKFLSVTAPPVTPFQIKGNIEIENKADYNKILTLIQNKIQDYITPEIQQKGYDQLIEIGVSSSEIFNGPLLKNGWVAPDSTAKKRDQISIAEITGLIASVPGVNTVSAISFAAPLVGNSITSSGANTLSVDIISSASNNNGLEVSCKGQTLNNNSNSELKASLNKTSEAAINIELGASVNTQTNVPQGKYRDINNYYSIQNTFPEIFAVGADALVANTSDFQIAQSRQLKGYLTLFDQVLANQFSQLANVDKLFSFKNSHSGTPSDKNEFYATKDEYDKEHLQYPVPYLTFSPTYFYQSLYEVPHIKPLLKGNETFKFGIELQSGKELEQQSWIDYQQDPYNPYIIGLMDFIEEEKNGLTRRNDILDHLLARHGESPMIIDSIIEGAIYSGDSLKDKVILKSLYLQNLGLLSYYRQKGYNYGVATRIWSTIADVDENFEPMILGGNSMDFVFDSAKIDALEKLTEQDFIDYSAFELKLNMLFGLRIHYRNFIVDNFEQKLEAKLALWMIQHRRGAILIENGLLGHDIRYQIILRSELSGVFTYWWFRYRINFTQYTAVNKFLSTGNIENLDEQILQGWLLVGGDEYPLIKIDDPVSKKTPFTLIPNSTYSFSPQIFFNHNLELIFPSFVFPEENRMVFKHRLNIFLQSTLPIQVSCKCHFVERDVLEELIHTYMQWHDSFIFSDQVPTPTIVIPNEAGKLTELLIKINLAGNE